MIYPSWKTTLLPLAATLLLTACGGHSDSGVRVNSDCNQAGQNNTLYGIMKDAYLWYEKVPDLDPEPYQNINTLLEDLKYKEYDKWSYITTQESYDSYFNSGAYIGFGFSLGSTNSHAYFRLVFKDSPAYKAGLKRGMEILEINGKTIDEIDQGELWSSIYGSREVGVEGVFKIQDGAETKQVTLKKEEISSYSILADRIWEVDGEKVGYFVFNKFIEPSKEELREEFQKFKNAGITQLILDLRYNGGGRVHIAQYLASLIAGEAHAGKVLTTLKYNDRYSHWNESYKLEKESNALGLSTLYVITTQNSCSASELLINGLKPFINVKIVGSKTCGKPVGMRGYSFCDMHLSPIQFSVLNAEEKGDYYDGLTPDCTVADDLTHTFGDSEEKMLQETLYLMQNGQCTAAGSAKPLDRKESKNPSPLRSSGWQRELGAI